MAIRDAVPGNRIGELRGRETLKPDVAAIWQRHRDRSSSDRAADRNTAITRTLASSTNPTLLHEHISDEVKGWH